MSPLIKCKSVDLPQPDGPASKTHSPSGTVKSISRRAGRGASG